MKQQKTKKSKNKKRQHKKMKSTYNHRKQTEKHNTHQKTSKHYKKEEHTSKRRKKRKRKRKGRSDAKLTNHSSSWSVLVQQIKMKEKMTSVHQDTYPLDRNENTQMTAVGGETHLSNEKNIRSPWKLQKCATTWTSKKSFQFCEFGIFCHGKREMGA